MDLEYLPPLTVPDPQGHFDDWAARSAEARRATPPLEVAYGPTQHERMDVFEPTGPSGIRATVVFVHGGYWRAFHKDHFSYLAPPLVGRGLRVVVPSHDLAPEVTLTQIVAQLRAALATVVARWAEPVVVTGHSAGGMLAAVLHTDPALAGRVVGGIGLSGLYDLGPLRETSLQPVLRISDDEVARLSPVRLQPASEAPFVVAVGAGESQAFDDQSRWLAEAWPGVASTPTSLAGRHHLTVCEDLTRLVEGLLNHVDI